MDKWLLYSHVNCANAKSSNYNYLHYHFCEYMMLFWWQYSNWSLFPCIISVLQKSCFMRMKISVKDLQLYSRLWVSLEACSLSVNLCRHTHWGQNIACAVIMPIVIIWSTVIMCDADLSQYKVLKIDFFYCVCLPDYS